MTEPPMKIICNKCSKDITPSMQMLDRSQSAMKTKTRDNGHDHVVELNGVTAFVFQVLDGGQQITVSGWHPEHRKFKKGERVLLQQQSGEASRYRITEVRRPGNPSDQYFMDCEFDPRRAKK